MWRKVQGLIQEPTPVPEEKNGKISLPKWYGPRCLLKEWLVISHQSENILGQNMSQEEIKVHIGLYNGHVFLKGLNVFKWLLFEAFSTFMTPLSYVCSIYTKNVVHSGEALSLWISHYVESIQHKQFSAICECVPSTQRTIIVEI